MISCESGKCDAVNITDEDVHKIDYRLNIRGLPFNVYALYNYGREMVRLMGGITKESGFVEVAMRMRYLLVVVYFLARITSPRYTFACDFSELPLILSLFLDLYNLYYDFKVTGLIRFGFLAVITGGCVFLRKRTTWRVLLNTWKEDNDDDEDDDIDHRFGV